MREFDWQNDGLFQRLFGDLEPRNVVPANVRLVDKDSASEPCTELLHIGVLVSILVILPVTRRVLRTLLMLKCEKLEVALTFYPPHRPPRSPFRSPQSPVVRVFHLFGPNGL